MHWRQGLPRKKISSCRTEIEDYITEPCEDERRETDYGGLTGLMENITGVSELVTRRFRNNSSRVLRTETEFPKDVEADIEVENPTYGKKLDL